METLKSHIQTKYHFSNYQMAQLTYLWKTFTSELSKILIMAVLFRNHLVSYLFALSVMLFLRSTTGGLHFYTYKSCLGTSILYLYLALYVLAPIQMSCFGGLLLLTASFLICYIIGPITSKYRPKLTPAKFAHSRNLTCCIIFLYAIIWYIIPENHLLMVGFWIIILHSLQLIAAKILRKEDV